MKFEDYESFSFPYANEFKDIGMEVIQEFGLENRIKILPKEEGEEILEKILLKFTNTNIFPPVLWIKVAAVARKLNCEVTFENVLDIDPSQWLASFSATPPFILFTDYNLFRTIFAFDDIEALVKLFEAAPYSELYISNYNADFFIVKHDNMYLSAYGQVAVDWLQGCIDEYNKLK